MQPIIRDEADLRAIEAGGFDAFLPHQTPYSIIRASAAAYEDRIAIRYLRKTSDAASDVTLSYGQLLERVRQAANLFRRLGVNRTDGVAILMPHTPNGQIALWGAGIAGRAFPINPSLTAEHLAALLRAGNVKVAVALGANAEIEIWPNVIGTLRALPSIKSVLACDGDMALPDADGVFEELLEHEPADRLTFTDEPEPGNIAAYFHTGGTTGAPKLALHRHLNQAFVGRSAATMYALTPDDVLVNGFPIFHVAGSFVYGLAALSAGSTLLIPGRLGMRNRDFVKSIWRQVAAYGITAIGAVPTILSALNDIPVDADISPLRAFLTGGSPLPTELADAVERHTGKPVRNILGMTECAGVVTIEPFRGPRTPGSTGLRLPFTKVQAFRNTPNGIDLNMPCGAGETGIVALSGPNVVAGYSDKSLNPGTFEDDWLVSGDLGHVDDAQRVFITGRAKDVIIRGAHNIDPGLIEDALLQHPAVGNAAAVGQPDAYAGELPVAFVSLKAGTAVTEAELLAFAAPRVQEPAARPKRIWILDALPLTPIGKIFKPALREIATRQAMHDAIAAAGVASELYAIEATPKKMIVRFRGGAGVDAAKKALTGMPASYDIVEG